MRDIEQNAREQLAEGLRASYPDDIAGRHVIRQLLADELDLINARVAVRTLAAALTPPDGYVLVPVELTHEMYCAFVEQWFTKVRAIDDTEMEDCYAALLAARPEVAS